MKRLTESEVKRLAERDKVINREMKRLRERLREITGSKKEINTEK